MTNNYSMQNVQTRAIVDEAEGIVAVYIEMYIGDTPWFVTGSAKCSSQDKFDLETGYNLAYGRALRQLGRELLHEGNAAVAAADRDRQRQLEAAEKARVKRERARQARVRARDQAEAMRAHWQAEKDAKDRESAEIPVPEIPTIGISGQKKRKVK